MTSPFAQVETRPSGPSSPPTHPLLAGRWSPVIFDPEHRATDEDLDLLLEAARWAPSASNTQPWAFVVCRRADLNHTALLPLLSRGNAEWVPRASVVLIGLAQTREGEDPSASALRYGQHDTGQAMAHISLQARAMGLETHQFAGFSHEGAREAFGIPKHFDVMAGIAIGRHAAARLISEASEVLRAKEARHRERREVRLFGVG